MTKKVKVKTNDHLDVSSLEQPIEGRFFNMTDRLLRIQRDLLMPAMIFQRENVQNVITIFGSARIKTEKEAKKNLKELRAKKLNTKKHLEEIKKVEMAVEMARYYTATEELSKRLQEWSNNLDISDEEKFYIMTGGGPGIMEAANKGAYLAGGKTIGATITLPDEQTKNDYVAKSVWMNFNYFLMRKFWLMFFAKAIVVFPGGTGTFDEFFELFTLMKTRKTSRKYIPTILFGKKFWQTIINFDYMVETDVITKNDLHFFRYADTVDEAFDFITSELERIFKLKKKK